MSGDSTLALEVTGNVVEHFATGISVSLTAASSMVLVDGVVEGNDFRRSEDDGFHCVLDVSGIAPSMASFVADVGLNRISRNDKNGVHLELRANGAGNTAEFLSQLYGNLIERNDRSGVFLEEQEIAGGVCTTQPDLGGGAAGSWGGNTISDNDDEYSSGVYYDLQVTSDDPVSARRNWWGTRKLNLLERHIFHQVDDPFVGLVDFGNFHRAQLRFEPRPKQVRRTGGQIIETVALPGTSFVSRTGSDLILVEYGDKIILHPAVSPDGGVLSFTAPFLGGENVGSVPLRITNPGQQSGEAFLEVLGDGEGGGFCFIATASYGDPDAQPVRVLRRWRDESLQGNAVGRWLVRTYYRLSPPIAAAIAERPWARAAVRIALAPVVLLVRAWLDARWLYLLAGVGAGAWWWRRRRARNAARLPEPGPIPS